MVLDRFPLCCIIYECITTPDFPLLRLVPGVYLASSIYLFYEWIHIELKQWKVWLFHWSFMESWLWDWTLKSDTSLSMVKSIVFWLFLSERIMRISSFQSVPIRRKLVFKKKRKKKRIKTMFSNRKQMINAKKLRFPELSLPLVFFLLLLLLFLNPFFSKYTKANK